MGRYIENYWDNEPTALESAVGGAFTMGITALVPDPPLAFKCELTDTESGAIGVSEEWHSTKEAAHNSAWHNMIANRSEAERIQELERLEAIKKSKPEEETELSAVLIKWAIYIALFIGAVWVAFNVVLPLVFINLSLIALISSFAWQRYRQYFLSISVVGVVYIILDYNQGWFTNKLVENVQAFRQVIPYLFYINIFAGLIGAYFLICDILNERMPLASNSERFPKRNLITIGVILLIGLAIVWFETNAKP